MFPMYVPWLWFISSDEEMKDELAGSTAVIVMLKDGKMFCVSK